MVWQYSNTKGEALGILHGLEKYHHYYFVREVHVITDHKLLVTIISKDVTMLSQWLQHIMLYIHQYIVQILYKTGPRLFKRDWLSHHSYVENQDQGIPGMNVSLHTISTSVDILICTSIEDIKQHQKNMLGCRC